MPGPRRHIQIHSVKQFVKCPPSAGASGNVSPRHGVERRTLCIWELYSTLLRKTKKGNGRFTSRVSRLHARREGRIITRLFGSALRFCPQGLTSPENRFQSASPLFASYLAPGVSGRQTAKHFWPEPVKSGIRVIKKRVDIEVFWICHGGQKLNSHRLIMSNHVVPCLCSQPFILTYCSGLSYQR